MAKRTLKVMCTGTVSSVTWQEAVFQILRNIFDKNW